MAANLIKPLSAALVIAGLVGCGGGSTSDNSANQIDSTSDTNEAVSTTVTTAAQAKLSPPSITISVNGNTANISWDTLSATQYSVLVANSSELDADNVHSLEGQAHTSVTSPFTLTLRSGEPSFIKVVASNTDESTSSETFMVTQFSSGASHQAGQSFTKLNAKGEVLSDDELEWHCVLDNITGLIWQADQSHDAQRYIWTNNDREQTATGYGLCDSHLSNACTTTAIIRKAQQQSLCGHAEWRLPNVRELSGLTHYDQNMPAIDHAMFPNTQNGHYWAAESFVANHDYAWNVSFDFGHAHTIHADALGAEQGYVRLVQTAGNNVFPLAN